MTVATTAITTPRITIRRSTAAPLARSACGRGSSAITMATAAPTPGNISPDLSLPLGNWFSAGMTHQNGYTMANLSARKQFDEGTIRTIGANLSRAISGDTGDDKTLSGGAYAQFDARYASGTLNVNSAADGYVNTNLTASGSVGWQGKISPPADEPTATPG